MSKWKKLPKLLFPIFELDCTFALERIVLKALKILHKQNLISIFQMYMRIFSGISNFSNKSLVLLNDL